MGMKYERNGGFLLLCVIIRHALWFLLLVSYDVVERAREMICVGDTAENISQP